MGLLLHLHHVHELHLLLHHLLLLLPLVVHNESLQCRAILRAEAAAAV
jgi:hypothetical protein